MSKPGSHSNSAIISLKEIVPDGFESAFRCQKCNLGFNTKLELAGHRAGKHRSSRCSICHVNFANGGELGKHKISIHGVTKEQLGWVVGGWNKAKGQKIQSSELVSPHEDPEFISRLNSPEYQNIKMTPRRYHEEVVAWEERKLREQEFRTFNTSNYTTHQRIPDIIAISPSGSIVAVEVESLRPYKSSIDTLRKKYTSLLKEERFFDEVLVEGFDHKSLPQSYCNPR